MGGSSGLSRGGPSAQGTAIGAVELLSRVRREDARPGGGLLRGKAELSPGEKDRHRSRWFLVLPRLVVTATLWGRTAASSSWRGSWAPSGEPLA